MPGLEHRASFLLGFSVHGVPDLLASLVNIVILKYCLGFGGLVCLLDGVCLYSPSWPRTVVVYAKAES